MDTHPFHKAMHAQRARAGLSLAATRDRLRGVVPPRYVPSVQTLHRMERGDRPEDKVDGIVVVGLAAVFGCRVSDLSQDVADELERVRDLLEHTSRCTTAPGPEQPTLPLAFAA